MNISFQAVLNTMIFSSIAIVLFVSMIKKIRVISEKTFHFLLFIILMIMLRLFVPFEILGVQNSVYLTRIYPPVYLYLTKHYLTFLGENWSVLSILVIFSLIGSIVCAVKLFLSYFATFCTLRRYSTSKDVIISELITEINRELRRNVTFRVVQSEEIAAPFLFGLRHPVIALPEITLSEEEWYYILSHEMAHYYHRDLWLRFVCEVLHIVYWWNPFVYLLRRQLIVFQERHIDAVITRKIDERRMLDYLSCLVKVAKSQSVMHSDNWIAEFNHKTELQDRIKRLLDSQDERPVEKKHRLSNILIVTLLVVFTLFLPNLIILEPDGGIPDELLEKYFVVDSDNSYLLLNEEGKYEIYVDDEYKGTVTQSPDDTLSVYNGKGELLK